MDSKNSKQSSNCCHCNSGSQYRYRNIGNSLHNTFLFIKRLSVFFIPFSKQNCIIYSGTQLDGTDNKICNIENRITTNIRNSQIAVSMVSTNIIGSMRDFIVNNNTIKTAPIASRFTFIICKIIDISQKSPQNYFINVQSFRSVELLGLVSCCILRSSGKQTITL